MVFADEERIEYYDKLHSLDEDRYVVIGCVQGILYVVYTMRGEAAPELTMEQYAEMAAIAKARRAKNIKPVVALRITPETLEKAKATGKGYTGFLSRLLDNAINDPQMVAKSL